MKRLFTLPGTKKGLRSSLIFAAFVVSAITTSNVYATSLETTYKFQVDQQASSLAVADIDGDGKKDISTTNNLAKTVTTFLGNGDGTFQTSAIEQDMGSLRPYNILVQDLDANGSRDQVMTAFDASTGKTRLVVAYFNEDKKISGWQNYEIGANAYGLKTMDIDRDGYQDVIVSSYDDKSVTIYFENGRGYFSAKKVIDLGGLNPLNLAVGYVNHDYYPDIVVATSTRVALLMSKSYREFEAIKSLPSVTGGPYVDVTLADVNSDEDQDIVTAKSDSLSPAAGVASLYKGTGDGGFSREQDSKTGGDGYGIYAGNLDNDGKVEIVQPISSKDRSFKGIQITRESNGLLEPLQAFSFGNVELIGRNSFAVEDVNNDGKLDVITRVFIGAKAYIVVSLNTTAKPGTGQVVPSEPISSQVEQPSRIEQQKPISTVPAASCVVPRLVKKTLAAAKKDLIKANCAVGKIKPRGKKGRNKVAFVVSQSRKIGSALPKSTKINLTIVYRKK